MGLGYLGVRCTHPIHITTAIRHTLFGQRLVELVDGVLLCAAFALSHFKCLTLFATDTTSGTGHRTESFTETHLPTDGTGETKQCFLVVHKRCRRSLLSRLKRGKAVTLPTLGNALGRLVCSRTKAGKLRVHLTLLTIHILQGSDALESLRLDVGPVVRLDGGGNPRSGCSRRGGSGGCRRPTSTRTRCALRGHVRHKPPVFNCLS